MHNENVMNIATSPGFRICLLVTDTWPGSDRIAYRTALFEGGVLKHESTGNVSRFSIPEQTMAQVRRALLSAAPPSGRVFACGRGWRDFVAQLLPSYATSDLSIVNLRELALALRTNLKARASIDQILQEFGVGTSRDTGDVTSSAYEDLLWAVLREMTSRQLVWSDIPVLLESRVHRPAFQRYSFDQNSIDAVPSGPGVYVMTDGEGRCLYVGKSANLRRRLNEYFRATASIPPKIATIRERIRHCEYIVVGSELEALLVEQRLIAEKRPELNVQRKVSERQGLYQPPAFPVAILCPSADPYCIELFLVACNGRAFQTKLKMRGAAVKSLARLLHRCLSPVQHQQAPANLTDWGASGNEICCRYFGRFRGNLQWVEIDGSTGCDDLARRLFGIARLLLENPPEPGEFRMGET